MNGEVCCLCDDGWLKTGGAAGALDHLGAGELLVWDHPVAVCVVGQSGGARVSGCAHGVCRGRQDNFLGGEGRGEEAL